MADILIRMEMPQNCLFCPCSFWDEKTLALWCHALSTYDDNLVAENVTAIEAHSGKPSKAKRPGWCPLVELPEHGDLISLDDAKTVITRFLGYIDDDLVFRMKFMLGKDCPVIVPSNKEEIK